MTRQDLHLAGDLGILDYQLGKSLPCLSITCGGADLRPSGGVPVSARELP
jgi:hypothetical protein